MLKKRRSLAVQFRPSEEEAEIKRRMIQRVVLKNLISKHQLGVELDPLMIRQISNQPGKSQTR